MEGIFVFQSVYVVSTPKLMGVWTKASQAAIIRIPEPYHERATRANHSNLNNLRMI